MPPSGAGSQGRCPGPEVCQLWTPGQWLQKMDEAGVAKQHWWVPPLPSFHLRNTQLFLQCVRTGSRLVEGKTEVLEAWI